MADVWISRKRWTCKYCNLTINDDVPSRRQHENGLRHKANVERALKGFYRKGEQEKRDADFAKREMEKIERQALASYALDQAAASASTSAAPQPLTQQEGDEAEVAPAASDKKTEWKPTNRMAAYSTAESLGYSEDPDLLRRQKEEEQRKEEGFAGQWESAASPLEHADGSARGAASTSLAQDYPPSERQQARTFKFKERQAPGLHDGDDVDSLSNIKVKKRIKLETSQDAARRQDEARSRMLPTWTPVRLEAKKDKSEEAAVKAEATSQSDSVQSKTALDIPATSLVKSEDGATAASGPSTGPLPSDTEVKTEKSTTPATEKDSSEVTAVPKDEAAITNDTAPEGSSGSTGSGGLFKKRRAGAGAGAKRVRSLV